MENMTGGKDYRDALAEELRDARATDKDLARQALQEAQLTDQYAEARESKANPVFREIEEILSGEAAVTPEHLADGTVEVKVGPEAGEGVGRIEYEFEVEAERRYMIEPQDVTAYSWQNHVFDTYDQSGRARVRVKNGKPRLSLKVPLFSKDTETTKTCLRLEFKPTEAAQEADLLRVRDLILEEAGAQVSEKWGAKLLTPTGDSVWINRDDRGRWWVEVDEGVPFNPPASIKVISMEKSSVRAA